MLTLAFLLTSPAAIAQVPVLLDFEDLPVGTAVYNQYPGVIFGGGDAAPPRTTITVPPAGALSGTQAVQAISRGEFAGSGMYLDFTEGQARVKLSVGLVDPNGAQNMLAILRGYDGASQIVAESPIMYVGGAPRRVDVPLEITSPDADILRAGLTILSENWASTFPGSPDGVDIAIDNLEYTLPVNPPPPDVVAPVITVETPTEGQAVAGAAPGALETYVQGVVDEPGGLRSLTLQLNGGAPVQVGHDANVGGRYRFLWTLFGRNGLIDGANEVALHAEDFAGNVSDAVRHFDYVVKPVPPPTDVDLVPIGIELNQAVSTGPMGVLRPEADGFSMTVPEWAALVQDMDTLVRVYAVAEGATGPIADVPARLVVLKDDCDTGCRLGELPSMDSLTAPRAGITVHEAGSAAATLGAMAQELDDTWNFLLPAAWTREPLRLLIDINTPTPTSAPAVQECEGTFLGECERGNRLTARVSFRAQHVATVNPILVRFQGDFQGAAVDDTTTAADVVTLVDGLNALYPTRFDLGPTRTITVDPNISGGSLLDKLQDRFGCQVADITSPSTWWACASDPTVFKVALVPGSFNLGAGGLANRGNSTVWAMVNRITPSHEVGHAIGFLHATCDHSEAAGGGCDGYYPGGHGRLLGIGFDMVNWKLMVDDPTSHMHDFMSYGSPRWASRVMWNVTADHPYVDDVGYDWCGSLTGPYRCGLSQSDASTRSVVARAPVGEILLVRGRIDERGQATFADAYRLESGGPPDRLRELAPTWQLVALDADGNTLRTMGLQPRETLGAEVPLARFMVELDLDGLDPSSIDRLELHDPSGDVIGELTARDDDAPAVDIASTGSGSAWNRDEIRQIRWTVASAGAVTAQVELHRVGALGMVLGSQLTEDALDVVVGELPSTPEGRIVVRVSDGIHTGVATSAPFSVAVGPPSALIIRPSEPITVPVGVPISLFGLAAGDTSPLPDEQLSWSSDQVGELGRGSRIAVAYLPKGVHEITLRAEGADGQQATASVEVTVGTKRGCGCATGPSGLPWLSLWVALALARRRRAGARRRA